MYITDVMYKYIYCNFINKIKYGGVLADAINRRVFSELAFYTFSG